MRKIIFKSVIKKKRPNKTKAILIYNLYSKFNSVFRNISILFTPILDFPYSLLAHPWALWINLNPTKQKKMVLCNHGTPGRRDKYSEPCKLIIIKNQKNQSTEYIDRLAPLTTPDFLTKESGDRLVLVLIKQVRTVSSSLILCYFGSLVIDSNCPSCFFFLFFFVVAVQSLLFSSGMLRPRKILKNILKDESKVLVRGGLRGSIGI